jgi:hypothetical protein
MLIAKLKQQSMAFVNEMSANNKARSVQSSIALAKVLSKDMSIPSAPVDDIQHFFLMQSGVNLRQLLADINEVILIDYKLVEELTSKFYSYRYYAAHPSNHVLCFCADTAVEDFFGITRCVSKDILEALKVSPVEMTRFVNGYINLVEDLKGEK